MRCLRWFGGLFLKRKDTFMSTRPEASDTVGARESGEGNSSDNNNGNDGRSGSVRALLRGLDLLVAINQHQPASVTQLVALSNLPKATVIRLLATLRSAGYIRQQPETGAYEVLPQVRNLSSALLADNHFLNDVREQLNTFGLEVNWPGELLMAESDAMVVVATNRNTSPIHLRRFEQRRFPFLQSAAGLVFLAALEHEECKKMVERHLDVRRQRGAESLPDLDAVMREVAQARLRGFARYVYHTPMNGLQAVAVAVSSRGRPIGALVLITLQSMVPEELLQRTYLPALRQCAARLGEAYAMHHAHAPTPGGAA